MAKKKTVAELSIDIAANTAKLSQDMGKATSMLGNFQKQVASMNRTMKGMFTFDIAKTLLPQLAKFSSVLTDLADQGEKVGSIRDAFEAIGGSASALKEAQKATLGTVSAFDLMATANQGLIRGIPQFNEHFGRLAELAQRFADSTGRETGEVLNQLTAALAKGKTKGLEPFGFALDGLKGKAEIQNAVFSQMEGAINRLAPSLDSVSNAHAAFETALDDAVKTIGIGVNNSESLTQAYRDLEVAVGAIDWEKVGSQIANIGGIFLNVATTSLPPLLEGLEKIGYALDFYLGDGATAKVGRLDAKISELKQSLADIPSIGDASILDMLSGKVSSQGQRDNTTGEIARLESERGELVKAYIKTEEEKQAGRAKVAEAAAKKQAEFEKKIADAAAAAAGKKRATEIEKAQEAFSKEVSSLQNKSLEDSVKDAITNLDTSAFQEAANKLKESYKKSIIDAHKEALANGVSLDAVKKYAEDSAQYQADKFTEEMDKAIKDKAAKEKAAAEDTYKDSVNTWRNLFSQAINGGGKDLESMLEEVAIGFASEIAAALSGGEGGATSLADIGGSIAKGISDALKQNPSSTGGSIGDIFGSLFGQSTESAHASGVEGPGMANGQFGSSGGGGNYAGYVQAGAQVVQAGVGAKKADKADKSNAGTGAAVGAGIGMAVGAIFGPVGAMVGAMIGEMAGKMIGGLMKWGPQNPETIARHAFANFIEEGFEKLGQVSFFDAQNKLQNVKGDKFNFFEGSTDRFNSPDWGKSMDSWGDKAKTTFLGLGEAMKLVLGITEDVGGQIGFLLGENLSGNIDNARLLVQQLGLSFEDMEKALVSAGKAGELSWHEVEVNLQGVAEAFKPGLAAVGAVGDAMQEIIASGGRGQAALKGVRDTAIETMEAGGKTLADMKKKMLEQGTDASVVDAFMQALEQRGIKTLDALANAQDRVAGGVIADLYSANKAIADQWDQMSANLENISRIMTELPDEKTIKINFVSNLDDGTQAAIDSGLIDNPTAGTSTSAPSLPATSRASTDGGTVSRSARSNLAPVTLHIDARGAQRGVEADIKNAMASLEGRTMRRTINAIQQMGERG